MNPHHPQRDNITEYVTKKACEKHLDQLVPCDVCHAEQPQHENHFFEVNKDGLSFDEGEKEDDRSEAKKFIDNNMNLHADMLSKQSHPPYIPQGDTNQTPDSVDVAHANNNGGLGERFKQEFGTNWTPENYPHPLGILNWFSKELERAQKPCLCDLIRHRSGNLGIFTVAHGKKDASNDYVHGANDQFIADQVKVDEIVERVERNARIATLKDVLQLTEDSVIEPIKVEFLLQALSEEKHSNPSESV